MNRSSPNFARVMAVVAAQFCLGGTIACAGDLVQLNLKDGTSIAGEVVRQTDDSLELIDLATAKSQTLKQAEIAQRRLLESDRSRIEVFSLPVYLAWQIREAIQPSFSGKIAQIDGDQIVVAIRYGTSPTTDELLVVHKETGEVKDPDTGEVLGTRRDKAGVLKVTQTEARFVIGTVQEGIEKLKVGDVVSRDADNRKIAVVPLFSSVKNVDTSSFAEEVTTGLVRSGIRVVERSQLEQVLNELHFQQTVEVDSATAQKVGRQLGAYAILIGSAIEKGGSTEAQLRLVRVDTGEILFACQHRLEQLSAAGVVPAAKREMKSRLIDTEWRYKGGTAIVVYRADGTVECEPGWGGKKGRWQVEDDHSIRQVDANPENQWRITFSKDLRTSTWVLLRTGETFECPRK